MQILPRHRPAEWELGVGLLEDDFKYANPPDNKQSTHLVKFHQRNISLPRSLGHQMKAEPDVSNSS